MTARMPWGVLADLQASDPGRPRLTWYDDTPGPTQGERIELSARVLANWVSKAGNLLQDECAAGSGSTVLLDLPAHWRAVYWALAAWSVGATVVVPSEGAAPGSVAGRGGNPPDVIITSDAERAAEAVADGADTILVSLAALGRSHPDSARAPGAIDEARELSTHGDVLVPTVDPAPSDVALSTIAGDTAYGNLVPQQRWEATPRVALGGDLAGVLTAVLSAYAADGSVVLTRGSAGDAEDAARMRAEGVTTDLR